MVEDNPAIFHDDDGILLHVLYDLGLDRTAARDMVAAFDARVGMFDRVRILQMD